MNAPACSAPSRNETTQDLYCWGLQRLLGWGAYLPWVRSHIIQAQYFKVHKACITQPGLRVSIAHETLPSHAMISDKRKPCFAPKG